MLDLPSQMTIKRNVLGKLLVRWEWKKNVSIRVARPHKVIIYKVSGSKMKGYIGKTFHDKRSRRTMREFLAQKGRIKTTNFDLVYWEDVDKMMDNSSQQLCLWVTKHVSKFLGQTRCYIDGKRQYMRYAPAA